jgi:hypothetical protein
MRGRRNPADRSKEKLAPDKPTSHDGRFG